MCVCVLVSMRERERERERKRERESSFIQQLQNGPVEKKGGVIFEAILKNCAYYVKTTVPTFWGFFWKIEHLFNPTSGSCFRK